MVQLWDLGSDLCKKSCVRKCSPASPHLCLGAALKLRRWALVLACAMLQLRQCCACAWPRALLIQTLAHRLNFLFDLSGQTYVASWDMPRRQGLPWQSLQQWLILVIVTSPAPFLHEAPLLMRLVPLRALLSPLVLLPLRRSALLLLPDRFPPRCFGNFISGNNTTEY